MTLKNKAGRASQSRLEAEGKLVVSRLFARLKGREELSPTRQAVAVRRLHLHTPRNCKAWFDRIYHDHLAKGHPNIVPISPPVTEAESRWMFKAGVNGLTVHRGSRFQVPFSGKHWYPFLTKRRAHEPAGLVRNHATRIAQYALLILGRRFPARRVFWDWPLPAVRDSNQRRLELAVLGPGGRPWLYALPARSRTDADRLVSALRAGRTRARFGAARIVAGKIRQVLRSIPSLYLWIASPDSLAFPSLYLFYVRRQGRGFRLVPLPRERLVYPFPLL